MQSHARTLNCSSTRHACLCKLSIRRSRMTNTLQTADSSMTAVSIALVHCSIHQCLSYTPTIARTHQHLPLHSNVFLYTTTCLYTPSSCTHHLLVHTIFLYTPTSCAHHLLVHTSTLACTHFNICLYTLQHLLGHTSFRLYTLQHLLGHTSFRLYTHTHQHLLLHFNSCLHTPTSCTNQQLPAHSNICLYRETIKRLNLLRRCFQCNLCEQNCAWNCKQNCA